MKASKQQVRRRMPKIFRIARARPKLIASVMLGLAVMLLTPGDWEFVTRILLGWDAGVVLYIGIVLWIIVRLESEAEMDHLRERAAAEDEGQVAILLLTVTATLASLAAIVILLGQEQGKGSPLQLLFASATILVALPARNSRLASRSTPWGVVRSLMPTSTAPRPRTRMSPPSVVACPFALPSPHTLNVASAKRGCQR